MWTIARLETKNQKIYDAILRCDTVLALSLDREPEIEKQTVSDDIDARIKEQIALRAAAKASKNYAEADRIRGELAAKGIVLKDTPNGTVYEIK